MAEPRRSGRQRKSNTRYTNDGWDHDTLRALRGSSESSGSGPQKVSTSSESEEDVALSDGSVSEEDYDDDISFASAASLQSSSIGTPNRGGHEDSSSFSTDEIATNSKRRQKPMRMPMPSSMTHSQTARSRGLQVPKELGKTAAYSNTFGPGIDDLSDVLRARDTWLRARDITIPSRQTLSSAYKKSENRTNLVNEGHAAPSQRSPSSTVTSDFVSLRTAQVLQSVEHTSLDVRYLHHARPRHSVVTGPRGHQEQLELDYLSTCNLGKAWLKETRPQSRNTAQDGDHCTRHRYHSAWLLNAGEKIQSLAWSPASGPEQYLAVAVKCTTAQREMAHSAITERPAFHPSSPYPSSIQIWAFSTHETDHRGAWTADFTKEPRLAIVLATEWGHIRHLKWRATSQTTHPSREDTISGASMLGLLAVLSSDGHGRVIAVPKPSNPDVVEPAAFCVVRPGLDLVPPRETIFTTIAFTSSTDLMLGTADGSVHLFDLTDVTTTAPNSYMQQQLHNTYIVALSSASPGPHSTLVASACASGEFLLTDLRSPEQDRVHMSRSCFPSRDVVYAPFTRSFITILDRSGNTQVERNAATFVTCHHIRQFPSMMKLARISHDTGAATALAGSNWHPCILIGNAKGQVLATNYLRKVLPYPRNDYKKAAGAYLQKICDYDWRPLRPPEQETQGKLSAAMETEGSGEIDLYHGHDVRPGVSRFHEGFKPVQIEVGNSQPSSKKAKTAKDEGVGSGEVVFEEEQAVTAIDWNPNAECAGLVAVGWGSGIVRVQDLAYDVDDR